MHFALQSVLGMLVMGICLEKDFGPVYLIVLYSLSRVGGSLMSALFLSGIISAGAFGALFGLLGATLSDLLINRTLYASKVRAPASGTNARFRARK